MTSVRWVSSTETGSIGLKPSRRASLTKASGMAIALMPKAGSRTSSPGTSGRGPSPMITSHVLGAQFLRHDRRAVNLDLIGLGRRLDVVGEADLRDDEAILPRELAAHLGDPRGDLVALRARAPP